MGRTLIFQKSWDPHISLGQLKHAYFAYRESSVVMMSLQATFSLASNVTLFDLADRMQKCVNSCLASAEVCQLLGSQRRIFRGKRGALCEDPPSS